MSVWSDISVKLEEGGRIVADKARELSQIANLRAQIVSCDNTMHKNYKELGKAYYEAHKDDLNPEYEDIMKIIADSQAKKEDLLEKLAEVRNTNASCEDLVNEELVCSDEESADDAFDEPDDFDEVDVDEESSVADEE